MAELALADSFRDGGDLPVVPRAREGCHHAYREDERESVPPSLLSPEFRNLREHFQKLGYVRVLKLAVLFSGLCAGSPG
jgi:hypothetical protein